LGHVVSFLGAISNIETIGHYQDADLFVNLSHTGSVDKAVLEAMSCGTLVLTSNEAFQSIVGPDFMVEQNQPAKLAEKIKWVMSLPITKRQEMAERLRNEVVKNHDLNNLANKIVEQFKK
jgi:glycosyltransferase involved in cell wall biosynthesis